MGCCSCCGKTGACCVDGVCTEETCQDCLDLGGVFQGVDTECVEGECPCDPPADPDLCEKCVAGAVVVYCSEGQPNCCDGVCQAEECAGECSGSCDEENPCPEGCVCVDGVCQESPGDECDCQNCTGSGEFVIDSQTLPIPSAADLCFAAGGFNSFRVINVEDVICREDGVLEVTILHAWYSDTCNKQELYAYEFPCDEDGCPSGEATLVSTTVYGTEVDGDPACDDPDINRECLDGLGPPSSVTWSPLP